MFKKKSLKFTYEKVSRDMRHVEALKARESSRFKRLSMIRNINDSDLDQKPMEMSKQNECQEKENIKPSRLEMLFKWKQEKQLKKEIEKMSKKQPFYAGGNKNNLQALKAPLIVLSNSSFNSSKLVKSNLRTPSVAVQSSRIQGSKSRTPSVTVQSSRIQSSKPGIPSSAIQSSKVPNSKMQGPSATFQSSRIPNSKQTSFLPKSGSSLSRSNGTAALSRKFPIPAQKVDKSGSLPKFGSNLGRSNNATTLPRKFPVPTSTIDKTASVSKVASNIQRALPVNKIPNEAPCSKRKGLSKPVNKVSSEPKSLSKCQEKSVKKAGTSLPKQTSNITPVSKGIPVQSKEVSQYKASINLRKGYCFKTAIANSSHQKVEKKASVQDNPKKLQEKTVKGIEKKPSKTELLEHSLDSIPDVTFNSDISMIKPAKASFAPANFIFEPPKELNNFIFDDDFDPNQVLEEIRKFMSRTSTPSKDSGRKSSIEDAEKSPKSINQVADQEKMSDISNSNDMRISELMTPESFKVKIENEEIDEYANKHSCNEVACDIITNIEIKDADTSVNHQACEELPCVSTVKTVIKDACAAETQQVYEELISVSPIKQTNKTINPQICEEIASDINRDLNKTKTVEGRIDIDFDKNEDMKGNVVNVIQELITNENQVSHSFKNEASQNTPKKDFFLDNEDSLLDSIDLNKMQLMPLDDDDTDEDVSTPVKNYSDKKSSGVIPKRVSMLKNLSVMNSIVETIETDECNSVNLIKSSKYNQNTRNTPRHSKRTDTLNDPVENHVDNTKSAVTPRRSARLRKISAADDNFLISPLKENKTSDVNLQQSIKLSDVSTPEKGIVTPIKQYLDRKQSETSPKRVSMLEYNSENPVESSKDNPKTGETSRRSKRLMKIFADNDNFVASPFGEKKKSNVNQRRSMRLIDLNTPEKAYCEKVYGENLDPNKFFVDFESPSMPSLPKGKKVSLLYSPDKRKSIRKSIRGDLMEFSPA